MGCLLGFLLLGMSRGYQIDGSDHVGTDECLLCRSERFTVRGGRRLVSLHDYAGLTISVSQAVESKSRNGRNQRLATRTMLLTFRLDS